MSAGPWEDFGPATATPAAASEAPPWADFGGAPAPAPAPAAPAVGSTAWYEQQDRLKRQRDAEDNSIGGRVRQAIGAAEAAVSAITSPFGFMAGLAQSGNEMVKAGIYKLAGNDQEAAAAADRVKPAMEEGQRDFTYQPRTEEGQDIAQGPVMREVSNMMTALGPTGPVAINPRVMLSPHGAPRAAARAAGDVRRAATDKAADALTPTLSPEKLDLAQKAVDSDIPLRPDMLTDNKLARMAGEAAEHVPFSGSKKKARQEAFTKNVVQLVDPDSSAVKLTPAVYDAAMNKAGETIGSIMERTDVAADSIGDLRRAVTDNEPRIRDTVQPFIDDVAKAAEENGGVIPGPVLRELRTRANKNAREASGTDIGAAWRRITKQLDDGLSEHAAEGDMAQLADARRRYAIGMALEPIVAKSPSGDISPAALMARTTADKAGKRRMARGKGGDMGDYARIGQEFLKEQASSGTGERNALFKMATDAATAAKAASLYPLATAYNMLGPRIAKFIVERNTRRAGGGAPEAPAGPTPLELAPEGPLPPSDRGGGGGGGGPAPSPLGDTVPDWQTAPGARPEGAPLEVVPAEGLITPLDEAVPLRAGPAAPAVRRSAGSEIPAVPGRPDLPDTMITGAPAEAAPNAPTGAAMIEPNTQLAMRTQQTARNVAAADTERAQPVPKGEATEIRPQVVEPAGTPKVKEPAPEKIPVGEATEIKPEVAKPAGAPPKTDERLAGLESMRATAKNDMVRKVIDKRIAAVKKEIADEAAAQKRREDAAELRRSAALTEDPDLKAALFEEAKAIEKADAIPAGKTIEGQPEIKTETPKKIPTGKAKEIEHAPDQVDKQAGVQQERQQGNEGGQAAEAGAGDRVQREGEGKQQGAKEDGETLADLDLPRIDESYIEHQQRAQIKAEPAPTPEVLERGRRQTRAAIEKGREDGTFGNDEADLALWALDKNPNLARGLRVETGTNAATDPARAVYNTVSRVIKAFSNKESSPERAVHEILHHSERMMPPEVQRGIRREWRAAVEAEIKKSTPEVAAALRNIVKGITGGKVEFDAMKQAFRDGVLDRSKHYHLANPSEFWAVNASRILHARYKSRNAWQSKAVQWTKEMVEHVKGAVGLRSDAPVLKALSEILDAAKNDGTDRAPDVLKTGEAKSMLADEARKPTKEERRAAFRKTQQRQ